ncbi:MAG: glycosyltransferase family 1 protein [Lentisphaerota bacterium]
MKPMLIAIEATLAQHTLTGMGQYVINLIKGLSEVAGDNYKFLLLHSNKEWSGPDFGENFIPVSYHFFRQSVAIRFRLNTILKKHNATIFHSTCTTGAPPHASVPIITTVHDIYPLIYPEKCTKTQSLFFKLLFNWALKSSAHFITVSNFTANELSMTAKIPANKITTTHLAPCIVNGVANSVKKGSGDYFLCVGALDPRKGQLDLIDGYKNAVHLNPDLPRLLFVGPDRGYAKLLCERIDTVNLKNKIQWLPFVDDQTLKKLFSSAVAFVFPSTYEGFGIPLLEAMCYGVPILCSDIPVFREIGGAYPIYIQPEASAWAHGLTDYCDGAYDTHFSRVVPSETLNRYSWRKCAEETLEVYKKVIRMTNLQN